MDFYASGTPRNDGFQQEEDRLADCRLFSIHGAYLRPVISWAEGSHHREHLPRKIMLDSGAYSAWQKGEEATLDAVMSSYHRVLEELPMDRFDEVTLINLDKIPGKRGVDPTPAEIEEALKISDQNFLKLEKEFGSRILPVFHQGESPERLDEIKAMGEYICVSPRNDLPERERVHWSKWAHKHTSGVRTHGLATTGTEMVRRVPWSSVDSARWVLESAYGKILLTVGDKLRAIFTSEDSPYRRELDVHIDAMPEIYREEIHRRAQEYHLTVDALRECSRSRQIMSLGETVRYMEIWAGEQSHDYQETFF